MGAKIKYKPDANAMMMLKDSLIESTHVTISTVIDKVFDAFGHAMAKRNEHTPKTIIQG